jgi:putative MATE family efflux protein
MVFKINRMMAEVWRSNSVLLPFIMADHKVRSFLMKINQQLPVRELGLFSITWPIFIETLLNMSIRFVDIFMLSFVSDKAVSAVGVSNELMTFTFILFNFVAMGTSVVISQFLGAGKIRDVSRLSANAISINLGFGLLISGIVFALREPLIGIYNLSPALMEYADVYLMIVGGTLFAQAMILSVSAIIRSYGYTKEIMYATLGMNVLNIIGNYLLIFGSFGLPELGVTGAAIATAVSRTLAMIALFIMMYWRLEMKIHLRDYIHIRSEYVKRILQIGIPAAGEHMSYHSSQMMITFFITFLGESALAARVYILQIANFIFLFAISVAKGMQILIGHMVGAGENERAYRQLFSSLKISIYVVLGTAFIVSFFREELLHLFTNNPEIITTGALLLLFSFILEPGRTLNVVTISSLRASGDARFPVLIGIVSMWGISIPLAYFLGIYMRYGLVGIWIAFVVDEWFRGSLMLWRWKSRIWEKKVLVKKQSKAYSTI